MAEFLRDHIIDKKGVLNIQPAYGLEVSSPGFKNGKTQPEILSSRTNYKVPQPSCNGVSFNSKCLQIIYNYIDSLVSILFLKIILHDRITL